MSVGDKFLNHLISGVRIIVEHVIAGVKRCRIVKDVLRLTTAGIADMVMEIACGLHNLRVSCRHPLPTFDVRSLIYSIGFLKMFRAPLCRHGAKRFTVSRHEHRDLTGSMGKMQQRSVDLRLQVSKLWEILQMRRFFLDLLPQVFDRVEIR